MDRNKHITISASGKGERIKPEMDKAGFPKEMPKSLLPISNRESLLGRIIKQSHKIGDVIVYINYDFIRFVGESETIPQDIFLLINRNIYGPMGPIYLDLQKTKKQSYMAAGDYYADFNWNDFIEFHNSHNKPVSILTGKSIPVKDGAKFVIDKDNNVTGWERLDYTGEDDWINIGAYIIDPTDEVMDIISRITKISHKEDIFNDEMIKRGLMNTFQLNNRAYNINNLSTYYELIEYLSGNSASVSE